MLGLVWRVGVGVRVEALELGVVEVVGVSNGDLRAHSAKPLGGLEKTQGSLGTLEGVGVLEVHQGDGATVGEEILPLLLVREAHAVGGGRLLAQERILPPQKALHVLLHR